MRGAASEKCALVDCCVRTFDTVERWFLFVALRVCEPDSLEAGADFTISIPSSDFGSVEDVLVVWRKMVRG